MGCRDYSKFLKEQNRLNIRLIPRAVWVDMVAYARQQDDIITTVLEEMFWSFDMDQLVAAAESEGRAVNRGEFLKVIMSDMSDSDWWKLMSAFEEQIMRTYASAPERWSEFLDPVFDLQEEEGWRERQ